MHFPDTSGKFAVLSRKFPALLLREFRSNRLIYGAQSGPLTALLKLNQHKFPVFSRFADDCFHRQNCERKIPPGI